MIPEFLYHATFKPLLSNIMSNGLLVNPPSRAFDWSGAAVYLADLKNNGWKFWKAFANNYRVYHWHPVGNEHGQRINIWQHHGGYLEIADLFGLSVVLVEAIQSGWLDKNIVSGRQHKQYWIVFDQINNRIADKHRDAEYKKESIENELQFEVTHDLKKAEAFYDRWRSFTLQEYTVVKIKELLANGWIEVQEDKREK